MNLCDVLGNCLLLRGPGRDVTDPSGRHRRGVRGRKWGGWISIPTRRDRRDGCDQHLTYLHTKHGKPRSAKALGGDFRQWCDAAGLPKRCAIHGLRKSGARRLAEAGVSVREIMSITGHKTLSEVQRNTDAVDQAKLAAQAIAKLRKRRRDA
jgi:integrase